MEFDPGYAEPTFAALCAAVPGARVYPPARFRTEWGPIFHRGRLDGSARVLVIGQDPAAHETIARRILCGVAGHRVQGFLWRLGIDRRYVMINAFVYALYGKRPPPLTPSVLADRYRWLDAILESSPIEAVATFGSVAASVWTGYVADRRLADPPVHGPATHPTAPVSEATLLSNWNGALQRLYPALSERDRKTRLRPYASTFGATDLRPVPSRDLPPGLPGWMTGANEWAVRGDPASRAPNASRITVTIPTSSRPVR